MVNTVKFSQFATGSYNTTTNFLVGASSESGGQNIQVPFVTTWTTATRPSVPYAGLLGYNSTTKAYEFWNGSAWVSFTSGLPTLTNGQTFIGNTGNPPTAATLTAGTNISIENAAGSITISATGMGGFSWTHVTGTSQAMLPNEGYVVDNAGLVTLTLPATSSLGDEIEIVGRGAGGWLINYGAGQQIIFGNASSTVTTGNIASTNRRDCINMVCTNANLEWTVDNNVGIITIV